MGYYLKLSYQTTKSYKTLAAVVSDLQDVTAVHDDTTPTTVADASLNQTDTGPRLRVTLSKPAPADGLTKAGDALAQTIAGLGLEETQADAQEKIELES